MSKHAGSCLCQNITFEIEGEFSGFYLCHCSRCRKTSGSAHGANLFLKEGALSFLKGEELAKKYKHENCRFETSFCDQCGSRLPYVAASKQIVVPAGSLDTHLDIKPNAHIFMASKANWDDELELIPKREEFKQ